jgi:myo-inositol-1(or 4)-monophosphatase
MPTTVSPPELLDVAVRAAHRAGEVLRQQAGAPALVGHKSSRTDPVTEADLAAEAAIAALLAEARPGDGLLGEEGTARASSTGLRWVVDPLDGTVNVHYGLPHYAVSIACEEQVGVVARGGRDWRALAAAVYDPTRDETFTAVRDGGARLDGKRIAVNDPVSLPQALVATGFAYGAAARMRQARAVTPLLARARDIRSLGSAALALCWVAAGRFDAYYEDELAPWDWAAGALIASEAGATVTALGTGVLAAGAALHPALAGIVRGNSTLTASATRRSEGRTVT